MAGKTNTKYFRIEATGTTGRTQPGGSRTGTEAGKPKKRPLGDFLRLAHTLKGASRVCEAGLESRNVRHADRGWRSLPIEMAHEAIPQETPRIKYWHCWTTNCREGWRSLDTPSTEPQGEAPRPAGGRAFRNRASGKSKKMDRLLEGRLGSFRAASGAAAGTEQLGIAPTPRWRANLLDKTCSAANSRYRNQRGIGGWANGLKIPHKLQRISPHSLGAVLDAGPLSGQSRSHGGSGVHASSRCHQSPTGCCRHLLCFRLWRAGPFRDAANNPLHKESVVRIVRWRQIALERSTCLRGPCGNAPAATWFRKRCGSRPSSTRRNVLGCQGKRLRGRVELRVEQRGTRGFFLCHWTTGPWAIESGGSS